MSHLQTLILSSLCVLSLAASPIQAATASLTLVWDGNTVDPDLAGYRVYQSTDSTVFSLTPSQAKALATTQDLNRLTTSTMLSGLDPAQVYWFAVTALDISNNESGFSNVVSAQPRDTMPPVVALTSPSSGAAVTGIVAVTANASDDVGVTGVQFRVDGVDLGAEDTLAPFSAQWNTSGAIGTAHALSARARDGAGNTTTSAAVPVTTSTPPTDTTPPVVALTSPSSGAVVTGIVAMTASASDNVGVAGVQFLVDGVDLGSEDTLAPFTAQWNTSGAIGTAHALSARARDAAGNTTTSAAVQVSTTATQTDTTPPIVHMSTPASGSSVLGSVTVSATASDNVGVWSVQFLLGGAPLGAEVMASPYAIPWDTTTAPNGVYRVSARARDLAGNVTTTDYRNITVSNPVASPCPDVDADGICDTADNCPAIYNPGQQNTDGDTEGGDACDITIVLPLPGGVTCADPPPTITWTPEAYTSFKVSIGTTPLFTTAISSGKRWIGATSWTVTSSSWSAICGELTTNLYIRVLGRNTKTSQQEYSETQTITVR